MALHDIKTAVDFGSSNIKIIVVQEIENAINKIIFKGITATNSINRGEITNTDLCANELGKILKLSNKNNIKTIKTIITNISSASITSINNKIAINAVGTITKKIIEQNLYANTHSIDLEAQNKKICFVEPFEFIINNTKKTNHPIGKKASTLQIKKHIIGVNEDVINNINITAAKAKLTVIDKIVSSIAIADLFLTDEQKQQGVVIIDIGAGTTDISIFINGDIAYNTTLEIGGIDVDRNISLSYDCSIIKAKELKEKCGFILSINNEEEKLIDFYNNTTLHSLSSYELAEVITNSYNNILKEIKRILTASGLSKKIKSGIILTGGSSKIPYLRDLALKKLNHSINNATINTHKINDINNDINELKDDVYYNALSLVLYKKDNSYLEEIIQKKGFLKKINSIFN